MAHTPIDRRSLVRRHNIRPQDVTNVIPLGNGEAAPGFPRNGKWVVCQENIKGW